LTPEFSFDFPSAFMADPLDLTFDRPKVVYRQISDQIRELIVSGRLQPGTKLPASAELAAKWDTHAATIHAALTPLVKEGLLTRQPKIGTFVSKRRARLSNVGIYYDSNIWLNQANAFKRAVHVALAGLLEAERIQVEVWFDSRAERQRGKAWPELARAVDRRQMQGVIATDVPEEVVRWLQGLPVLSAYFTYAPVRNRVSLDFDQFAEASVALLKKQGCRSAGLISILEPGQPAGAASSATASRDFYAHFATVCAAQGIEVRSEWIRTAHGFVRDESQEEFGYKEFRQIWRQARRPDGLVVFPDTSVPGVILSVLEQRVNVPAELRLVVHKHAEINFLCPLPITYLYSSTEQIARALFSQLERQFGGETCDPIVLPFHASLRTLRASG
jgi:DNA-binding LacI/PurR family transcriptional regulator/DNA-binding transcriptional regulator YhcF (GntR family)